MQSSSWSFSASSLSFERVLTGFCSALQISMIGINGCSTKFFFRSILSQDGVGEEISQALVPMGYKNCAPFLIWHSSWGNPINDINLYVNRRNVIGRAGYVSLVSTL